MAADTITSSQLVTANWLRDEFRKGVAYICYKGERYRKYITPKPLNPAGVNANAAVAFTVGTEVGLSGGGLYEVDTFGTVIPPSSFLAKFYTRMWHYPLRVTELMGLVDGEAASPLLSKAVTQLMWEATEGRKRDYSRRFYGDGRDWLGQCKVYGPGLAVTMSRGYRWLKANQVIDIRHGTTGVAIANGTGRTIQSVVRDTSTAALKIAGACTITLDAAGGNVTTAVTDYVFKKGDVDNTGAYIFKSWMGIEGLCNSSNPPGDAAQRVGKIDADANADWNATVLSNATNRWLTLQLITELEDEIHSETGESADAAGRTYCGQPGVLWGLSQNIIAQVQTVVTKVEDGYTYLQSAVGHKIWSDPDCMPRVLYALPKKHLYLAHLGKGAKWQKRGTLLGGLALPIAGTTESEMVMYDHNELATDQRNSFGRINNLKQLGE